MARTVSYPQQFSLDQIPDKWILRDGISPERLRRLYWDKKRSVPEIARGLKANPQTLYELMRKEDIPRRSYTESNFLANRHLPQFRLKENLTPELERLRIAGLMLYWAEGAKRSYHTVDLTNSDPRLIQVFLRFLREICGVAESRLRVYLYVYEGQDVDAIRKYWSKLTRIPKKQFLKPYISRLRPDRTRSRVLPNGIVHIRYCDARLLKQLFSWIDEAAEVLSLGAGARVAKGAGL